MKCNLTCLKYRKIWELWQIHVESVAESSASLSLSGWCSQAESEPFCLPFHFDEHLYSMLSSHCAAGLREKGWADDMLILGVVKSRHWDHDWCNHLTSIPDCIANFIKIRRRIFFSLITSGLILLNHSVNDVNLIKSSQAAFPLNEINYIYSLL